jgi:hypothetical protein
MNFLCFLSRILSRILCRAAAADEDDEQRAIFSIFLKKRKWGENGKQKGYPN